MKILRILSLCFFIFLVEACEPPKTPELINDELPVNNNQNVINPPNQKPNDPFDDSSSAKDDDEKKVDDEKEGDDKENDKENDKDKDPTPAATPTKAPTVTPNSTATPIPGASGQVNPFHPPDGLIPTAPFIVWCPSERIFLKLSDVAAFNCDVVYQGAPVKALAFCANINGERKSGWVLPENALNCN